ncbi:ABC transporter ATP-binding protein [Roseicyclus sp. F158]|uniref:ABC transporter ATP-binding protein n=1 Tax=Tropicimonas omnivorans TaxID=3075590 RepID=A0ABU3DEU8_9RHOB|nr:ABC transporter ATP-binding protein [Roseicyclus sp. F158]MDT0682078.1 ABC transporter ATP-binding protein [Roseicyclus sp. F158]
MEPLLQVRDLKVDFKLRTNTLHAVRGMSFEVREGETLCIVGESGCGKSMTSLALMDLLPRAATRSVGAMRFGEVDLTDRRAVRRVRGNEMAMIFQEPMTALNPAFPIGDQMTEAYIHHTGATGSAARARAVEMLNEVGIASPEKRLGQYPHQLSGGLRQRVMIAMALMTSPKLLIADEPTTALDVTIQAQILRLLRDLQQRLGIAIVFITHDLGLVSRIADRIVVMYAGARVEEGSAAEIFGAPRHPYTQALIDCIPQPGKSERGAPLGTIPGVVPSLMGDVRGCAFRSRCPVAQPICADAVPLRAEGGHVWACIHGAEKDETERAPA